MKAFKSLRRKNGQLASTILYLLYLEKLYNIRILKFLRKLIWQPIFNLQICPKSFDRPQDILTLHLPHPFMIIIHEYSHIGKNCTIYHECTIGLREHQSLIPPYIGDNVFVGCKSVILGNVNIGDNTRIGAASIILSSTTPNSVITGLYKGN